MRPIEDSLSITRIGIILTIGIVISFFVVQYAHASMVIAPSKIVTNSNIDDENYRKNSTKDTTVKAIIQYWLAPGSRLSDPEINLYRVMPNESLEVIAPAVSIRYCFDDDNLIVEFDRDTVAAYLKAVKVGGVVDVVVEGVFTVTLARIAEDGKLVIESVTHDVDETAQILSYNPVKDK